MEDTIITIRTNALSLVDTNDQIRNLKQSMEQIEHDARGYVLFDPKFKNDAQRQYAIDSALFANNDYIGMKYELNNAMRLKGEIEAELEYQRNKLALEMRNV